VVLGLALTGATWLNRPETAFHPPVLRHAWADRPCGTKTLEVAAGLALEDGPASRAAETSDRAGDLGPCRARRLARPLREYQKALASLTGLQLPPALVRRRYVGVSDQGDVGTLHLHLRSCSSTKGISSLPSPAPGKVEMDPPFPEPWPSTHVAVQRQSPPASGRRGSWRRQKPHPQQACAQGLAHGIGISWAQGPAAPTEASQEPLEFEADNSLSRLKTR